MNMLINHFIIASMAYSQQSSPYPASPPGPTVRLLGRASMPNPDSAPWMQAGPVASSTSVPTQSVNMDDLMVRV